MYIYIFLLLKIIFCHFFFEKEIEIIIILINKNVTCLSIGLFQYDKINYNLAMKMSRVHITQKCLFQLTPIFCKIKPFSPNCRDTGIHTIKSIF